jgi:prophage DNA circulation protein
MSKRIGDFRDRLACARRFPFCVGVIMIEKRRPWPVLPVVVLLVLGSVVCTSADEVSDSQTAPIEVLLDQLKGNRAALDAHYRAYAADQDEPLSQAEWLSDRLRHGDSSISSLLTEQENLQRRLIHHAPTQEGPGTVTADSKDAPERVPQKESAVDHQLAMLREEIIVLDEQLRELATVNSSSAEDQEQIKTKRAEKVAELIALLGQRQFLDGSK